MTTDNEGAQAKHDMIAAMDDCILMEDAIRAYRDRASMEAELSALRQQIVDYDGRYAAMAETIERTRMELIQGAADNAALRAEVEYLKAALSGRTVSCSNCNEIAAEVEWLRSALREIEKYNRCYSCGGPEIARAALEQTKREEEDDNNK